MKKVFSKILSIRPVNPFRITILYALLSLMWIFFSDKIVIRTDLDYFYISLFSTMKGFLFILVTSALLYLLISNAIQFTQKQIERSEKSEKVYKLISENINDVVWILNVATRKFTYVSPSILKQRGFSPEEIYLQNFEDNIHPNYWATLNAFLNERIEKFEAGDDSLKNQVNELEQICKDGSTITVRVTTSLISNREGKVIEICGRTENISDWKITHNSLNALAISFSLLRGKAFFEKVCEHIAQALGANVVYVGQLSDNKSGIQVLGGYERGLPITLMEYPLSGSPCQTVIGKKFLSYAEKVQQAFPNDQMLKDMGAESYMGSPLFDKDGNSLGIIVLLDSKPIKKDNLAPTLFKIFSERVAAEIERSNAEELISKSEEKYHQLFEANKDGITIFPIEQDGTLGKFLECNEAAVELQGYSKAEMLQLTPIEIEQKISIEQFVYRKEQLQTHGVATFETILINKDGFEIDVEIKAIMIQYNQKPAIMNITRDISERKRTEKALRESEVKYKLISQNSADVIWILSLETGKMVFVSPSVEKLLGFTPEEVLKQDMRESLAPESFEFMTRNMPERIRSFCIGDTRAKTTITEIGQYRKDGSIVYTEAMTTLVRNADGKVTQLVGVSRDITERKRTREALQKSEKSLATAMEIAKLGHWEFNIETNEFIFNDQFFQLMHTTFGEVGSYSLTPEDYAKRFIYPDDQYVVEKEMKKAIASTELNYSSVIEHRIKYPDGGIGYISVHINIQKNNSGNIIKSYGVNQDITEKRLIEETIRESEEKFKVSFITSPDSIIISRLEDGLFLEINNGFTKLTGYSKEDVLNKTGIDVNIWEDPNDRVKLVSSLKKDGVCENLVAGFKNKDGSIKTGLLSATLIKIKNDLCVISITRDITEIILTQEALRESEERYKELYELSPDAIVVHQDGKIIFVNPASIALVGAISELDLIGRSMLDFVHPDYKKLVTARVTKMSQINHAVKATYEKFLRLDGSSIDVEVVSTPIKLKGKIAYQVIARDITERKKVDDTMRASEEKFAKIFENAPILITINTFDNPHFIDVNQMCCELSGFSRDEIIGKPVSQLGLITASDRQRMFEEITKNGNVRNFSLKLFTKDEKVLDCLCYGEVIYVQEEKCLLSIILDITERKKAEELVRESEQKLSALIESTPDIICFKDAEGKWLKANHGILEVYGLTNYDYANKTEWDMAPFTNENLRDAFRTCGITDELAWLKGSQSRTEEMIPDKNGSPRFFDVIKVPLFYENGNRKALVVFGRDITERKKSEQVIRGEKDKFSKTFFTSPDGLVINRNDDAQIIELNNGFSNITGYSREELLNKSVRESDLWVDLIIRRESETKILTDGTYQNLETEFRRKDGQIINVLISAAGINVDGSDCTLYLVKDITNLKKAEIALRESEERYRDLFVHLMDGFAYHELVLDKNGDPVDYIFLAANPQYEILTGLKIGDIIGRSVMEVIPTKGKSLLKIYSTVAMTGEAKRFESFNEETGMHFRVLAYSPEKLKFATIIENITDKVLVETELKLYRSNLEQLVKLRTIELNSVNKKLEDELRKDKEYEMMLQESLKKEKELSELKTRFISTASHEFRTPLTSILSSTELIERYRKKWSEEKFDEHFNRVKNSVEYLTKLLDDVLLISRTDSGKVSFNPSTFALKDFCEEVLHEAAVHSKHTHVINFIYQPKRKKFFLDKKLLKFILVNILSNAYKYSPNGGTVKFCVKNNKSNLIFSVSDEGIGIPDEEKSRLFEPFHRSKNSKDIPGTGLGLSIVKRSVDLHNGRLTFDSQLDKGTIFTIYLPLQVIGEDSIS